MLQTGENFLENLVLSKELLLFLDQDELISYGVPKELIKDKIIFNCTTDLPNKDYFDSKFFGYSRDEAAMMYLGHRFFHKCVCVKPWKIQDTYQII